MLTEDKLWLPPLSPKDQKRLLSLMSHAPGAHHCERLGLRLSSVSLNKYRMMYNEKRSIQNAAIIKKELSEQ